MSVSDEFYRRIVMAVPEGIWVVDAQGRTIFSNRRMAEILGTEFESMAEQSCFACVFPDELADAQGHFARALSGDRRPFDFRLRRANGSPIWVSISCMPIRDDTGAPAGLLGLFSDISDRKQGEAALRESEERFRVMFNLAAVGVAQVSLTGHFELVNDRSCEILGYTREELLGMSLLDISHSDDLPDVIANTRRLLAGEIPYFCTENRYFRKDGSIIWSKLHKSCVRDREGRPKYSIVVLEDITEQRLAQAALRESEERFRNMADAAPVLIWVCGPDKHFTFFNKTWLDFTGRSMEQELGKGLAESVHPEDLDRCLASFSSSFDARQDFHIECRLRRADGEYRWMLCKGVPRFPPGGVFGGYIGSSIDVTDQRLAEGGLRRSLDEIAHLNRVAAMGELTASLAHELNQPLAAILSNAQAASRFLNRDSPDLARVRECLADIVLDDKRAGEVIDGLRGLLRKGQFQSSSVDLNEVVSDAIRLVRNDALLRNTSVVFEPFSGLARIPGDRIQLCQVALNLIMNSLEATTDGPPGKRWVSVRTAEAKNGGVQLTVEDSGRGVAAGDLGRVFEPFFSTKREGLGMGLAISRSIVQAHNGQIWAENREGSGAIFHCVLPIATAALTPESPIADQG